MSKSQGDRRRLGWLTAAMLFAVLSSPAWGLDLDHEIAKNEAVATEIRATLGRSQPAATKSKAEGDQQVQVKLIKRVKKAKRS